MNLFYRNSGQGRLSLFLLGAIFFAFSILPIHAFSNIINIDIKGVVKSNTGEILIGSTVRVKATQKGTVTNEKGEFVLTDVNEGATLVVTMIGFLPKELPATRSMSIELAEDAV